jgi:WD40 repeat protein
MGVCDEAEALGKKNVGNFDESEVLFDLKTPRDSHEDKDLEISAVAWSCSGTTLAISLAELDCEGLSNRTGSIFIWNIFAQDIDQSKPIKTIESEGSVTALAFHLTKPSILASGNMNGEIYIWDVSKEEMIPMYKSKIGDYFHTERITSLLWMQNRQAASIKFNLLSMSTDGKILVWDMMKKLQYPTKGHMLFRKKEGVSCQVAGTSISQSIGDKNTFIVGSEAGSLFRCTITNVTNDKKQRILFDSQKNLPGKSSFSWREDAIDLICNMSSKVMSDIRGSVEDFASKAGRTDITVEMIFTSNPEMRKIYPIPMSFNYEPHFAPVNSSEISPFFPDIFLTAGYDGVLRVYDLLTQRPLVAYEVQTGTITHAKWSLARPSVAVACTSVGEVVIFDFLEDIGKPVETLKVDPNEQVAAYFLQFNSKKVDLVGVGAKGGLCKVFRLQKRFTQKRYGEDAELGQLFASLKNIKE